jgi:MFS family permease
MLFSLALCYASAQIASPEFIWLTVFFLVNSFWANFYIGTFDMQLGDKHSLTAQQRHAFAQTFTLVITLGVLAIPPVGALMDRKGFPATSLLCIGSGIVWALLLLADSPERHLLTLSFVFYSIYRTSFFTFFFAYLADVLGFRYFGMLGGIIFLLAGILGMLQYPLALYAAGDCHVYTSDQSTCDKGRWALVNTVMVVMVTASLYFTYQDYLRRAAALASVKSASMGNNSGRIAGMVEMSKPASYGAV